MDTMDRKIWKRKMRKLVIQVYWLSLLGYTLFVHLGIV